MLQSVPVLNHSVFKPWSATVARRSPLAVTKGSRNFAASSGRTGTGAAGAGQAARAELLGRQHVAARPEPGLQRRRIALEQPRGTHLGRRRLVVVAQRAVLHG